MIGQFKEKVGCRGFPAHSVLRTLGILGITGKNKMITQRRFGCKQKMYPYGFGATEISTIARRFQVGSDQPHWPTSGGRQCKGRNYR